MRLEPLEKAPGLKMKIAYWMARRELGKVPSMLKVAYARAPGIAMATHRMAEAERKALSIPRSLSLLVHMQASRTNDCGFCLDIGRALAVQEGVGLEKLEAIGEWPTSPLFDDAERAALAYVSEINARRGVGDETFETLRKHWSERAIVEITWVNALANFYNLINVPLGLEGDGLCVLAQQRRGTSG